MLEAPRPFAVPSSFPAPVPTVHLRKWTEAAGAGEGRGRSFHEETQAPSLPRGGEG